MNDTVSTLMWFGIMAAVWFVCGLIGSACASGRGRGRAGFWLGFLLGPIGCVIALLLPADRPATTGTPVNINTAGYTKRCTLCGRLTDMRPRTCPDCGGELQRAT